MRRKRKRERKLSWRKLILVSSRECSVGQKRKQTSSRARVVVGGRSLAAWTGYLGQRSIDFLAGYFAQCLDDKFRLALSLSLSLLPCHWQYDIETYRGSWRLFYHPLSWIFSTCAQVGASLSSIKLHTTERGLTKHWLPRGAAQTKLELFALVRFEFQLSHSFVSDNTRSLGFR